jgi:large subunit ribosomal protein L3
MPLGLLGKKLGMTQFFEHDGKAIPVTVIEAGACYITQIKKAAGDGYSGIQIGFAPVSKKAKNPIIGHCKKVGLGPFRHFTEIRMTDDKALESFSPGQELRVEIFKEGEYVDVIGRSKGKGFQGVVKRHGFKGGPATRGSMQHRAPGSIGGGNPQRVIKGRKMAGHMGNERVTVQNLKVIKVLPEKNLLLVRGAVPGSVNGLVFVRKAIKKNPEGE